MKGAREYVQYVQSGVYGRLRVVFGEHARGHTLNIYVIPEAGSPHGSVKVYGVISGQAGWTEEYGWLVEGPWVADFDKLVEEGKRREEELEAKRKAAIEVELTRMRGAASSVLSSYVTLDELAEKADAAPSPDQGEVNHSEDVSK